MEYRSARVIMWHVKGDTAGKKHAVFEPEVDAVLARWATAGWTLHSQSVAVANGNCDIVWLIFQK
jgi:hypothetical protein